MFECKYKFTLDDNIACAKYVYKSQKRVQDKIIAVLIPILIAAMVAMLVADIINKKNFVFDLILLVALVILQILYITIPIILANSTKKSFKQNHLEDMDYLMVTINDLACTLAFYKNDEIVSTQILSLKSTTSYIEDSTRLIIVLNKVEYVCIKKENLVGGLDKLKNHLQKIMAKTTKK